MFLGLRCGRVTRLSWAKMLCQFPGHKVGTKWARAQTARLEDSFLGRARRHTQANGMTHWQEHGSQSICSQSVRKVEVQSLISVHDSGFVWVCVFFRDITSCNPKNPEGPLLRCITQKTCQFCVLCLGTTRDTFCENHSVSHPRSEFAVWLDGRMTTHVEFYMGFIHVSSLSHPSPLAVLMGDRCGHAALCMLSRAWNILTEIFLKEVAGLKLYTSTDVGIFDLKEDLQLWFQFERGLKKKQIASEIHPGFVSKNLSVAQNALGHTHTHTHTLIPILRLISATVDGRFILLQGLWFWDEGRGRRGLWIVASAPTRSRTDSALDVELSCSTQGLEDPFLKTSKND